MANVVAARVLKRLKSVTMETEIRHGEKVADVRLRLELVWIDVVGNHNQLIHLLVVGVGVAHQVALILGKCGRMGLAEEKREVVAQRIAIVLMANNV
jgi:hypothetical protein